MTSSMPALIQLKMSSVLYCSLVSCARLLASSLTSPSSIEPSDADTATPEAMIAARMSPLRLSSWL